MMLIRAMSGVITSRGVIHRGVMTDLPEQEATALIRMGRAVPCEDAPVVEHRDDAPVVKRSRKKAD